MNKYTQQKRILDHLNACGTLTRQDAMRYLSIANLTARISDLRKAGHRIVKEMRESKNAFGEPVRYAVYKLEQ